MERVFDRGMLTGIGLLAALILGDAGISYWNARQVYEDGSWVAHTQEVLAGLGSIRAEIGVLETSQRNYVITADDVYLESFRQSQQRVHAGLTRLAQLTADNPPQQSRIQDHLVKPVSLSRLIETLASVS